MLYPFGRNENVTTPTVTTLMAEGKPEPIVGPAQQQPSTASRLCAAQTTRRSQFLAEVSSEHAGGEMDEAPLEKGLNEWEAVCSGRVHGEWRAKETEDPCVPPWGRLQIRVASRAATLLKRHEAASFVFISHFPSVPPLHAIPD